jgi:hypothetical protein
MRTPFALTLPVVMVIAVVVACESLDNIDVSADGQTTIPMRSILDDLLGPVTFLGFEQFQVSESQEFHNQGYTEDQIDSVRIKRFVLTATDPSGASFDFLDSIAFFAEAPGLPKVEIARLDPVPDGRSQLELEILDVELRDYSVAESMTITTTASGTRPEQETTVNAALVLNVDINVGGAVGCSVASR